MAAKQPPTGEGTTAVEAYLARVSEPAHSALENLRATIRSTVPDAEEAMVYGAPGFRLNGRALVCYAAHKSHCGFYPMSPALMDTLAAELAGFRTAKGTIRFAPDQPLPDALVRKIVKARVRENGTGKGA